jgi:methylated-DNA-[protein]-cysteine S-methyltransferase
VTAEGFALFDTAIGRCGVAWSGRGVARVQLPEATDAATRARIVKHCPSAVECTPPDSVQHAIDGIIALLSGDARDLTDVVLDLDDVSPFERRVYEIARTIQPGSTLSYGAIASALGTPGAARGVGRALGRNPFAIVVPCHRVLGAGGAVGGFSGAGGVATKLRMLDIEGGCQHVQQRALFP